MPHKIITSGLISVVTILAAISLTSCNGGGTNSASHSRPSTAQAAPSPSPKTEFEERLEFVRKGQYTYVWVLARKDGKPIDKDDAAFLRKTAPQVVDWVTSDQGKRVIAGTNFDLVQGNLEVLKKRFVVEDYTNK